MIKVLLLTVNIFKNRNLFPIEIDTGLPLIGTISIAKINLVLKGTVNILSEAVGSVTVWKLTLT